MPDTPAFTWCDLSTFDLAKARAFYGAVLGWTPLPMGGGGPGDDYTLMQAGERSAAGLYTMPDFFQSIRMPSFWMSYVRVPSIEDSYAWAAELGAKCEIEPTHFDAESRFALVRDPAGAGFTLYEGPDLEGRDALGRHGRMAWNELHVPSIAEVEPFYRGLFGWETDPSGGWRRELTDASGNAVAAIAELDEASKGPKNYWAVIFAVNDVESALASVAAHGGEVLSRPDADLGFAMALDDQGAMFCLSDRARG